jgi:histidyl-tRNA synthetase
MIQLIRGFRDVLPGEVELWQHIEKTAVTLFEDFGYHEIRIPLMERTELFSRSIGEDTDIVEKEMYTFPDRGGELITLRPEATASIVRSYIQHQMAAADPVRKFYMVGPMFRRERPQKGRYRQFYQIDAEIFGVASPYADVELIYLLMTLMDRLKVTDVAAHVNSLGCPECRPNFKAALLSFLSDRTDRLCADCNRRREKNPLRTLDCKVPSCREALVGAPSILDFLCEACRDHFQVVTEELTHLGVPFEIDKRLVRGLDYYTRTAFEILTGSLGAQSAVAGGGRYDGLVKSLGGPDQPAIGFAVGFDRLAEIAAQAHPNIAKSTTVYLAPLGDLSKKRAFDIHRQLGKTGIRSEMDMSDRALKGQLKRANRLGVDYVVILGDAEIEKGVAMLRDMNTKAQEEIRLNDLISHLQLKTAR